MGGGIKSVAGTLGRVGSGVFTLGGSEIARNNLGARNPLSQALQLPGAIMTDGASAPQDIPSVFGTNQGNPYVSGPFSLDPNQVTADQNAITGLGEKQYQDTLSGIDTQGKAAQDYAAQTFQRMLPNIAEDYNGRHLLDSTGYQSEAARQASYLSQDVANKQSQARLAALTGRQGFEQGALGRGLSLEDFINQGNMAKSIGTQTAPQVGSGKGSTGTLLSGIGSLAPLAGAVMGGPAGGMAGKAAGRAIGGQPQLPYGQV